MSVSIQIISDLHTEFWESSFMLETAGDILVLAGDIGVGSDGLGIFRDSCPAIPVIYVAGNHEYYRNRLPDLNDEITAESEYTGICFLEKEEIVLEGIRFLGCTLWSDYMLLGAEFEEEAKRFAGKCVNDYRLITKSPENRPLTPDDTAELFRESREWLEEQLAIPHNGPTVVVTHHAPNIQSLMIKEKYRILDPAFASNLEDLMLAYEPELWIHGHTHLISDYQVGRTRVISNQYGYPRSPVPGFKEEFTVDL